MTTNKSCIGMYVDLIFIRDEKKIKNSESATNTRQRDRWRTSWSSELMLGFALDLWPLGDVHAVICDVDHKGAALACRDPFGT